MVLLRKIVSVSLALLVLVASASFTVNLHLCGGHIHSIAIIEQAAPCPMEANTPACHKVTRTSCCQDEQLVYESQDFKVNESVSISPVQQCWVVELPVISEVVPIQSWVYTQHDSYKPPALQHDIPVLIQSFLI